MAAPRKYSVELQQRATRMAIDARKDPGSSRGAIKRIADQLGVPYDKVEIVHGDTDKIPFGMGTYGPGTASSQRDGGFKRSAQRVL